MKPCLRPQEGIATDLNMKRAGRSQPKKVRHVVVETRLLDPQAYFDDIDHTPEAQGGPQSATPRPRCVPAVALNGHAFEDAWLPVKG